MLEFAQVHGELGMGMDLLKINIRFKPDQFWLTFRASKSRCSKHAVLLAVPLTQLLPLSGLAFQWLGAGFAQQEVL